MMDEKGNQSSASIPRRQFNRTGEEKAPKKASLKKKKRG